MTGCEQRFLCDEMLARLGRWLRAAGYDVVIATAGEHDWRLLEQAINEQRIMLSRDRKLLEHKEATSVVTLISGNQLSEQLREVSKHLHINWLCQPFSRCLVCNSELEPASEAVIATVPPGVLEQDSRVFYCRQCDKAYWNGSHVKRMQNQLDNFTQGFWDFGPEEVALNGEQE